MIRRTNPILQQQANDAFLLSRVIMIRGEMQDETNALTELQQRQEARKNWLALAMLLTWVALLCWPLMARGDDQSIRMSVLAARVKYEMQLEAERKAELEEIQKQAKPTPAASPTPMAEVTRVINLLPKPEVAFVDFGCGADARWCIAAAEKWQCPCIGIEIDQTRAAMAKRRVKDAGLSHLIRIIQGDATATDVQADVGVAYLYQDTLAKLKSRIEKLKVFVSYSHQPPVRATRNGDSWIYTQPGTALWAGRLYTAPECDNSNCGMCASIRAQLAANPREPAKAAQSPNPGYHLETQTMRDCNGRRCRSYQVQVWVKDR